MDILFLAMIQATGETPARTGGGFLGFLPLIILFFLFWVMIIVPQRRQARAHQDMVAALQKGDQVVTAGGLIGVITSVRDDSVELRTGSSTVVVERARVTRRVDQTQTQAKPG
ncbi:MAG TPA: preprotein translocase subunit YajC [Longimicrobium sp.]|nr:preprotein translocase subunit YajC [Longimicrobium sp.]